MQTSMDLINEDDFDEFGPAVMTKQPQGNHMESLGYQQTSSQLSGTGLAQLNPSTRKKQEALNHL